MLTNEESVNLFHGNSDTFTTVVANQADRSGIGKSNNNTTEKQKHSKVNQASTSGNRHINDAACDYLDGQNTQLPSQVSPSLRVVSDDATDEYTNEPTGDTAKHFNLTIVNARSTGSTPSTSIGSCKTDDSNSYPLSSSTSTAASGSQKRRSPFYRRRRHSDPLQSLSATLARKSAYQEITAHSANGKMKEAPSTLSLVTTLKEKQSRLTRMSFCQEDPKIDRRQSPASSSSCPVAHLSSNVSNNLTIHHSRRPTIHASRSFAADSHINSEYISYGCKSSRGATLPAIARGRAHTIESTRSPCNNNNNNPNNSFQTRRTMSSVSLDSNTSTDSVDSFELALAVAAKSGCWISPGTRHLLHRLFVKIAGVADQLQSNHATDLRMILRAVFKMHSTVESNGEDEGDVKGDTNDSSDDVSVEEALEAREESSQTSSAAGASGVSSSSSSSSIVNKSHPYDFSPDDTYAASSNVRLQVSPVPESSSNYNNPVIHLDRGTISSMNMPSSFSQARTNPLPHQGSGHGGPRLSNSSHHTCSHFVGEPYMPMSSSAASSQASSPLSNSSLDTPQRHRRQIQPVMDSSHLSIIPPHHPNHHHQRNRLLLQQQQLLAHGRSSVQPYSTQPAQAFVPISQHSASDPMIFNRRRAHSEGGDETYDEMTHPNQNHWVPSIRHHQLSHGSTGSMTFDPSFLPPIWVPDELVDSCTSCRLSFNLIRRRHHCRNCGQIYCNNCSSHSVPLSHIGYNKPVRVCDRCFVALANPLTTLTTNESSSRVQSGQADRVNCCHHLIHCYPHESLSHSNHPHVDPLYDRNVAVAHGSSHYHNVPSPSLSSTSTLTNYPSSSLGSTVAFNSTSSHQIV